MKLTQAIVRDLLHYDPDAGQLFWKRRPRKYFKSARDCNAWNARYAGQPAFTYRDERGRVSGKLLGWNYRRSHIAWLYMKGHFPSDQIDHDNRKPGDDRWCNIFEVTGLQNKRNKSLYRNNTSGHVGVRRKQGRYIALIGVQGRERFLGSYAIFDEACAAREAAERQYGFSLGHGRRRLIRSAEQTMH